MNSQDRSKFLTLIETKNPALLTGVDREHVTDDHIMALVAEAMMPPPAPPGDVAARDGTALSAAQLQAVCDAHQLIYHTSERVTVIRDGAARKVWEPRTRPMQARDILAHRVLPDGRVRVTTGDGRRLELGPPAPQPVEG